MAVYDPRAVDGRHNELIPLGKGLDLTTTPTQRAIGSLLDAINVELVDGVLQGINGAVALGESKFNRLITDLAILDDNDGSDGLGGVEYNLTGTITNFEKVHYWEKSSQLGLAPQGSGYWFTINDPTDVINYQDPVALILPEGMSPEDGNYFIGQTSGAIIAITNPTTITGFRYVDRYTDVSSKTYSLLWAAYKGITNADDVWDAFDLLL